MNTALKNLDGQHPSRRFNQAFWVIASLGIAIRLYYLASHDLPQDAAEAQNVANSIATGHGFADAYFPGSGPTAHLTPTMPLIAGGINYLTGIDSPLTNIILETLVLGLIFFGFYFSACALVRFGVPRIAALGADLIFSAVPIFMKFEVFYFRYWEGALAVFLQSIVLLALAHSDCRRPPRWVVAALGIVPALLAMVLPPLAIAATILIAVNLFWQRQLRLLLTSVAGFCIVGLLIFLPWTLRNAEIMHRPIFLRSNLGLELALGMGKPISNIDDFLSRTKEIHPFQDGPGRKLLIAEGELQYFDRLLTETKASIINQPTQAMSTLFKHFRQMIIPDRFEFGLVDGSHPGIRVIIYSLISISGLLGLAAGAWRIDRRLLLPLLQVLIMNAFYAPFQPISRYLYINYFVLLLGAMLCAYSIAIALGKRYFHYEIAEISTTALPARISLRRQAVLREV